jgi:peroxiredoxin
MASSEFADLPRPTDDGAARGLEGRRLPDVALPSTAGGEVRLSTAPGRLVLYVYPSTAGTAGPPAPGWREIPGAFGCTAESCAFRDRKESFDALGVTVMGMSAQTAEVQSEFAARKEINFPLLSDPGLILATKLGLPTFTTGVLKLYKRLTLVAESGLIVKVFYPVFPPDTHPADVLAWAQRHFQVRQ